MTKPLVTIITPAYNCAKYIAETVESVLSQSCDIGYFVLDDGSADGTWELMVNIYKDNHHHWGKLGFSRHQNIGEQRTVNEALEMVKGKYFMIVNADDPLLPGAVEQLLNFMEAHPDVLCAYPDWKSINEDGSTRTHIKSRKYDFAYMVRHHTCLPSVGSMFRSSVIRDVGYRDASFHWLGDFDYWLRIGLAGKMASVPVELATWRHRDGQASGDKSDKRAQEHIRIMQRFYLLPSISDSILKVRREAICWSYLVATAVTDSKLRMVCYLFKALRTYPSILLGIEFWDALVRRASYILRR